MFDVSRTGEDYLGMPSRLGCWSFSRLTGNESTAEVVVLHGRLLRAAVACPGIDVDHDHPGARHSANTASAVSKKGWYNGERLAHMDKWPV